MATDKLKILLLNNSLVKGGKERRLIELLKGLKQKNDVSMQLVLFSKVIDYPEIHKLDIPLHILERKPKKDPRVFYRLLKICYRFRPHIIHSWSSMATIFAVPSAKLLNIKLINGNIADAPKNLKIWEHRMLHAKISFPFSDVVIANCKAGLEAYAAPKSKGIYIHNGFDFNRVSTLKSKEEIREQLQIPEGKVVGMIAAFSDRKDYRTFLQAAFNTLSQRNDVSFVAVGDGPSRRDYEALVPSEFGDRLIFTGLRNDVESIINIFDIGVLSTNSEIHGEGISNAIMEYMVLGKPVVATSGGGTDEIVIDGVTGFLIPPKSPDFMSRKIGYLLDNPELARAQGKAGQQRIYDHFGLDKMTESYYQLYRGLIVAENH